MNVKPGDIARVTGSTGRSAENNGRLVQVVGPAPDKSAEWWEVITLQSMRVFPSFGEPKIVPAGSHAVGLDRYLRPLHDGDGEDETLTWAGKPNDLSEKTLLRELERLERLGRKAIIGLALAAILAGCGGGGMADGPDQFIGPPDCYNHPELCA